MSEAVEATGKTVEDAIDAALEQMGATEDEVEIQILAEGGPRGILGRKVEPARVRVKLRDERSPEDLAVFDDEDEAGPGQPFEAGATQEQADAAVDFVDGLLDVLDLDGEVSGSLVAGAASVEVFGPEMGLLIGRRGVTLDALQELMRAAVQRKTEARARVNLDIEGYRERQRSMLERKARDAAAKVRRSGRPISLEPMNAYERKVVHDALTRFSDVSTTSEGDEPNRRVIVRPKNGAVRRPGGPRAGGGRRGAPRVRDPRYF